ncbi:hypothetical protein Tco_1059438, partial [Tanacetum coccineum]
SFEAGKSFVSVTKQLEDTLPLEWENGSRLLQQGDGTLRSSWLVEIMSIGMERHGNWTDKVNIILMPGRNYGIVAKIELRHSSNEDFKKGFDVYPGSKMGKTEINTLTMEQYLALTRGNQAPSMVKLEIRGNVNFEIKSQFIRELREETFLGNINDDAHEHVERILDFISLFNILGVTHDIIMLRVFPITLTEAAKRWADRLPPGTINT